MFEVDTQILGNGIEKLEPDLVSIRVEQFFKSNLFKQKSEKPYQMSNMVSDLTSYLQKTSTYFTECNLILSALHMDYYNEKIIVTFQR